MKLPRILLSAAGSGSGKTLLTCGILKALKNRGIRAASFKCGPDYIDPMFHSRILETKSRNLDTFFTKPDTTRYLLGENARDCDIAVIEGVMGYYDGLAGISVQGSAYEVSGITKTPAVLIVNCKGMSVSIVPQILGFIQYQKDSRIGGVILNRMSAMLYPRVKAMIEGQLDIKVLGYVPELSDCVLESRHLGLVLPDEVQDLKGKVSRLAEQLEKSLDIDALLALAGEAEELFWEEPALPAPLAAGERVRIAVARDEAFCFLYEDNLRLLEKLGAVLVEFSPLHDTEIPQADGLLLPGGYPELYARQLSENTAMREAIYRAVTGQMPCLAECGGFMYLHREMEDMQGGSWPMAGVIDAKAYRTGKLGRFGYIHLKGEAFGHSFENIPAHEFHYFDSENCGEAFEAQKPLSSRGWKCMHTEYRMLAGFPHLYYYGAPEIAAEFLRRCAENKERAL